MTRRLIVLLICALALASCSSPRPTYDWCFHFDFTQSNYGINLLSGNWISGRGFTTPDIFGLSSGGHVEMVYSHSGPVTPSAAVFYVVRPEGAIPAPIDFEGEATIFGMQSGFLRTVVPQEVNYAALMLQPGQGTGTSSGFSIAVTVSRVVEWRGLDVMGSGANPFPQNNCSDFGTPTPDAVIDTPDEDIFNGFADADSALESVNDPLGTGRLPADNSTFVFGLMKWLVAPTTAQELMGPFAPVLWHVGIFLTLDVALVGIYVVVYTAVYIVRWVIWLIKIVLLLIQTIASTATGLIGAVFRFIAR